MRQLVTLLCVLSLLVSMAGTAPASPFSATEKDKSVHDKTVGPPAETRGTLDCSDAVEVALAGVDVPVSFSGDNSDAPNNVTHYGCSAWDESGGEVVYRIALPEARNWRVTITPSGCDLDLALLDLCDEEDGCVMVADGGVTTNYPVAGDFFVVVDGYNGARCAYTITFTELYTPPPAPAICDIIVPLSCDDAMISGDTCDSWNFVSDFATCQDYVENGLEDWYSITLHSGGSFAATVFYPNKDAALWVFDSCDPNAMTCLVSADATLSGQAESIAYTNESVTDVTIYFVVDAWGNNACGAYEGSLTCTGGVIPAGEITFGGVKAMFR